MLAIRNKPVSRSHAYLKYDDLGLAVRLNMRDTLGALNREVTPGGTSNVVDLIQVGFRNSVHKADFNSLVLQSSMGAGLDKYYISQPLM